MEDTTGFAKILADPESGQIIGCHVIGPQAPSVIQPVIQAMSFGLDAYTMARGQYWIHPAMPELIENALLKLDLGLRNAEITSATVSGGVSRSGRLIITSATPASDSSRNRPI